MNNGKTAVVSDHDKEEVFMYKGKPLSRWAQASYALIMIPLLTSPAAAQTSRCVVCNPRLLLEPAAFARNLDADAEDVDFLARVHVMAETGVPRLGVSLATQWVVPHGNEPMVMLHLAYKLLKRPVSVAPFLGVMNLKMGDERVSKLMTALYVTAPTSLPRVRLYGLGTLVFADGVIPSLGVGLSVPSPP